MLLNKSISTLTGPAVPSTICPFIYRLPSINPEYTTRFEYDSLSRKVKAIDLLGNIAEVYYDKVGNKRVEILTPGPSDTNSKPRITRYSYTPQYWVKSVTQGNGDLTYKVEYEYDKTGNKLKEIYPDVYGKPAGSNEYQYEYDGFGRVIKVVRPDGSYERYQYDAIGNKIAVIDGRGNITRYYYNGLNKLSEVLEPTGYSTRYYYDPNGNLVRKEMANGLRTDYEYNALNLLKKEVKVRANDIMEREVLYDKAGNVITKVDPRGNITSISYYRDGQIKEEVYYRPLDETSQIPDLNLITTDTVPLGYELEERVSYEYDKAGNLIKVTDGLGSLEYTYDKLARIIKETRVIDSNLYTTEYEYDFQGNIKKIKYPESDEWVSYEYNSLNQLIGLSHAVSNFKYDPAGNLIEMAYNNGVTTLITPEVMGRAEKIEVKDSIGKSLLDLNYAYDENGNVIRRNNNIYTYDQLDRLKTAEVDGTILVDRPAKKGYIDNDYFMNMVLNYEVEDMEVEFDYASSTIGIKFDICQDIGRIELLPDENLEHRISKSSIRIFYRTVSGGNFVEVSENDWVYDQDTAGKVILTFKEIIEAVEIKIHSNFDDRDIRTGEVINRAEFSNLLNEMVRVYGRYNRTKISYEYDEVGNRISETYTGPDFDYSVTYNYDYYSNSNRLKVRESEKVENIVPSNGSYVDGLFRVGPAEKKAYRYDKAGNLIEKGNKYSISGDSVGFTEKSGNGVLYWKYEYNAKNRLTEVFKDGESEENRIARYGYDFSGKRLKVEEGGKITYYVYNYFGQLIYEDGEKDISYIYAHRKVVAKVEGSIGSGEEKYYYYHHDNLGSTRLITDEAGKVVFEQDYSPFGRDLYKPGRYEKPDNLEAGFKYTGQIADVNTGLYYYNARY